MKAEAQKFVSDCVKEKAKVDIRGLPYPTQEEIEASKRKLDAEVLELQKAEERLKQKELAKAYPTIDQKVSEAIATAAEVHARLIAEYKIREEIEDKEKRQKEILEWKTSQLSKIPQLYEDACFDNYNVSHTSYTSEQQSKQRQARDDALMLAKDILNKNFYNAIFYGLPGCGKTYLSFAVYRYLIEQSKTVERYYIMDLVYYLRDGFDGKLDKIHRLAKLDLLIIDNVGSQSGTASEINEVFTVLYHRTENRKTTLITSNYNLHELQQYLGEFSVDRFLECGGLSVHFDWPSGRGVNWGEGL